MLSPKIHMLPHGEVGDETRRDLVVEDHHLAQLYPQALDDVEGLFLGEASLSDIAFEVGVHVLIETAGRYGDAVGLHLGDELDEPEKLDCLVEGSGGLLRYLLTVRGDLQ